MRAGQIRTDKVLEDRQSFTFAVAAPMVRCGWMIGKPARSLKDGSWVSS